MGPGNQRGKVLAVGVSDQSIKAPTTESQLEFFAIPESAELSSQVACDPYFTCPFPHLVMMETVGEEKRGTGWRKKR